MCDGVSHCVDGSDEEEICKLEEEQSSDVIKFSNQLFKSIFFSQCSEDHADADPEIFLGKSVLFLCTLYSICPFVYSC